MMVFCLHRAIFISLFLFAIIPRPSWIFSHSRVLSFPSLGDPHWFLNFRSPSACAWTLLFVFHPFVNLSSCLFSISLPSRTHTGVVFSRIVLIAASEQCKEGSLASFHDSVGNRATLVVLCGRNTDVFM